MVWRMLSYEGRPVRASSEEKEVWSLRKELFHKRNSKDKEKQSIRENIPYLLGNLNYIQN